MQFFLLKAMLYNRGAANLQHDKAIENLQYDLSQDEEANEPSNFQVFSA